MAVRKPRLSPFVVLAFSVVRYFMVTGWLTGWVGWVAQSKKPRKPSATAANKAQMAKKAAHAAKARRVFMGSKNDNGNVMSAEVRLPIGRT